MKKWHHSNLERNETDGPAAKKQKIEAIPMDTNKFLLNKIKPKIVEYMDSSALAKICMVDKFFKKSAELHLYRDYKRSFINPLENIYKAVELFINIWLHGEINLVIIDDDNFTLKVTHHISKNILFNNIPYDDQDVSIYYATIFNAITSELPIKNQFFWEEVLIRIKHDHTDINTRGPEGQTLLSFVCDALDGIDKDNLACLELLIENGADIFNENKEAISPLQHLIDRLICLFCKTGKLTPENTFSVFLVELLLKKFDNAKIIKELVFRFSGAALPLFEIYLFLHHHPDADIRNLFQTEVEKSRHKEDFLKLFNKNNFTKKLSL